MSPTSGGTATEFLFLANYKHVGYELPVSIQVNISGTSYAMDEFDSSDDDPRDGKWYNYTTNMSIGSHYHYFWTVDGNGRSNTTATANTPTVISEAIGDCEGLQAMEYNLSGEYHLTGDIDCTGSGAWNSGSGFEPVGTNLTDSFRGSFNGNNHTIYNLAINRSSIANVGLFGVASDYGLIRDVNLADVNITGKDYVGGLVGYGWRGDISNVHVSGAVSSSDGTTGCLGGRVEYSQVTASDGDCTVQSGGMNNGGLIGLYYGNSSVKVTGSKSTGSVTCGNSVCAGLVGLNQGGHIEDCYSSADVSGGFYSGGLLGANFMNGTVSRCYASGTVSGTTYVGGLVGENQGYINASFSKGPVSGSSTFGGLVGWNRNYNITYSYWDETNSGQAAMCGAGTCNDSAGVTSGLTYWHDPSNPPMTVWDLSTVWYSNLTTDPFLAWEKDGMSMAPTLSVALDPEMGSDGTLFNFTAIYRDMDDDAPQDGVKMALDGTVIDLEATGADWVRGVAHYRNLTISDTSPHQFSINASDGTTIVTSSTYDLPIVYSDSPTCDGASPGPGWDIDQYTNCTDTAVLNNDFLNITGGNKMKLTSSIVYHNGTIVDVDGIIELDASVLRFI